MKLKDIKKYRETGAYGTAASSKVFNFTEKSRNCWAFSATI